MKRRQSSSSSSSSSSSPFFFFFLLVVFASRRTSRTSFSRPFVLFVSVCSSSPSRSPASVCCSYVCVIVSFNFHFFAAAVVVFFSGASHCFKRCPSCALGFFFVFFLLLLLNVVIRGGVFLHFFLLLSNNTHTRAHVLRRTHHAHTRTHRQTTDGMGEKSARAPLVLGGTHKTILRLLIVVLLLLLLL